MFISLNLLFSTKSKAIINVYSIDIHWSFEHIIHFVIHIYCILYSQESSPPSVPISRNKVSHSDTAHTSSSSSPPSKTHLHPPSQQDPSLLTDLLNSARTDQRPLSNTSRTTQDTNISRGARSRPTTGAAVNVEIAEYDENDESPSFRERVPAVRFELPKENEKAGGGEKKTKKKGKSKSWKFFIKTQKRHIDAFVNGKVMT